MKGDSIRAPDDGRVPAEPGSRASTEPQSTQGLGPPGFDPSRCVAEDEFCLRATGRLSVLCDDGFDRGNWFVAWSPRNYSYCAEGSWDEWVELARRILAYDAWELRQSKSAGGGHGG